jgi:hypothetical protein
MILATVNHSFDLTRLKEASNDELKSALTAALQLSVEYLSYLAAIWAELDRRGEDMRALKEGMGYYLAKIAGGTLDAGIVVKYASQPAMIRLASHLPIDEQKGIVDGKKPPWESLTYRGRRNNRPVETKARLDENRPVEFGKAVDSVPSPEAKPITPAEYLVQSAAASGPKDLVDRILKMVRANGEAADVARRLIPELEKVIAEVKRPKLVL